MITAFVLTSLVFVTSCLIGALVANRYRSTPVWLVVMFVLSSLPAIAYVGYYLHLIDEPITLYRLRAMPGSELLAGLIGLPCGWFFKRLGDHPRRWVRLCTLVIAIAPMLLVIPYAKVVTTPLEREYLRDRWEDGICLQSTGSTCGPSSAATLLHALGLPGDEATLAAEAHTSASGTEIWYLARALRTRGVEVSFTTTEANPTTLPFPAIAGTRIGGPHGTGHFIAILGRDGERYVIGDPMQGRRLMPATDIGTKRWFTGFFLVVEQRG